MKFKKSVFLWHPSSHCSIHKSRFSSCWFCLVVMSNNIVYIAGNVCLHIAPLGNFCSSLKFIKLIWTLSFLENLSLVNPQFAHGCKFIQKLKFQLFWPAGPKRLQLLSWNTFGLAKHSWYNGGGRTAWSFKILFHLVPSKRFFFIKVSESDELD